MASTDIAALVADFVAKIVAATEADAAGRMQAALSGAFGTPAKRGPGRPAGQAVAAAKPSVGRRKMTLSPKAIRARKIQGQYLGALRALGAGDKAKVKAVAKDKGVAAAVKLALTLKKPKA